MVKSKVPPHIIKAAKVKPVKSKIVLKAPKLQKLQHKQLSPSKKPSRRYEEEDEDDDW